ncbi:sugar phosphate nucleotidyltransferase [Halorubrum sp. GN11GM_10-3_MGM]|uniref:sugar phosphate nucleotidyltransferase n=1 Tax=Halorubrum sp. GN11GM_10-3_MGM TaxID=2518111 RepID=UPI0010F5926C|nr:sugar phosphate nucleotidyltransferase [Halorubrum sp. GN11GM_10-3_MGM]TKX71847.1 glucose-1-phosphate thymidylyltransferase [Halorubrum sp. GN11GM_10-3_MGM]
MNNDSVTAVILAAGEGRRLAPLTNRRPKPMVPVANRPLLEHVVEAVTATTIDRIVLVVGYKQERIRNHFGDGDDWGVTIEYVEQATQLGTGHAVLQAESVVDGPFVVLNGDRIVDPEIVSQLRDSAVEADLPAMAVTSAAHPRQYGVVTLDGERVTAIDEKPEGAVETNQINAGVYAFSPAIFDAIRETHAPGELAITATLDDLAANESLSAVRYDGRWLDVSNIWDLLTVNAALIGESSETGVDGPTLADSVTVADDVALAGNVRVGPNVTIGGSTAIGSNATVEAGAVVENAVVFPDAVIGAGAVVRNAIVAGNARIGPNTTVAGGPATVVVGDAVHHDVELAGVVGDNATVGAGATLTDGAVVGDDVDADAGVVIDDRVESGAVVRRG